jgi:Mn2+/Fe2+ NRAMP family transporter
MYRPTFYAVIGAATVAGVALNFAHVDAIRALFLTAVINGVVAPPLLLLIVLLGSDRAFMGDRASAGWSKLLTWAATILMALAALAMSWTMLVGR